ncbi:alpha/beta fold hydrolase (plasmid) [Rhizobium leguminosarum]
MKHPCANVPRVGELLQVHDHKIHLLRRSRANRPEVVFLHGCGSLAEEVVAPFEVHENIGIIAPDRPGYGFSSPLPSGSQGPLGQSFWLETFLEHIGGGPRVLVGHSIGCAPPLLLAQRRPDLVRAMLLIAPCCRPVSFKPFVLLRTAMMPMIGSAVRRQMTTRWPEVIFRSALRTSAAPNPVPEYLAALPARHILSSRTIETMAAELSAFNADMAAFGRLSSDLPITVVFGDRDGVIDYRWHSAWIQRNHDQAVFKTLRGVGHLPHHVRTEVCVELLELLVDTMSIVENKRTLVA